MKEIKFNVNGIDISVGEVDGEVEIWFPTLMYPVSTVEIIKGKDLGVRDFGRSYAIGFADYAGPEPEKGKVYEVTDRSGSPARWFCIQGFNETTMISESKIMKTVPVFKEWVDKGKFSVRELKCS